MAARSWAREELKRLQAEYHDFNPSIISRVTYPTPLTFSKQVSKGLPCVFKAPLRMPSSPNNEKASDAEDVAADQKPCKFDFPWAALAWSAESLTSLVTEKVEVAVTPTGRADAIVQIDRRPGQDTAEKVFLKPASINLTLSELLYHLSPAEDSRSGSPVYYLQSQNSNLTTTPLTSLMKDLPQNFAFAVDVLGTPDARNIWIGSEQSVTSLHHDPYENLYLVLKGRKTFRLWPPVDEISMETELVSSGSYVYNAAGCVAFDIHLDDDVDKIPWIDLDPLDPDDEKKLVASGAKMRTVIVGEGEILYLPSGWYHHVSQSCGRWADGSSAPCIAINYWYDMDYEGDKYVSRQLVSRLVEIANGRDESGSDANVSSRII